MPLFKDVVQNFKNKMANYVNEDIVEQKLLEIELKNIKTFGYGIKSFTLSLIECALEITEDRIDPKEIRQILKICKDLMDRHPVPTMAAKKVLESLVHGHQLMIITKGDLFHQELKVSRFGLSKYFDHLEYVTHKDTNTYKKILAKYETRPDEFIMVGNSIFSDILPVIEAGGYAVHIPYPDEWIHETVSEEIKTRLVGEKRFFFANSLDLLPQILQKITG